MVVAVFLPLVVFALQTVLNDQIAFPSPFESPNLEKERRFLWPGLRSSNQLSHAPQPYRKPQQHLRDSRPSNNPNKVDLLSCYFRSMKFALRGQRRLIQRKY